LTGICCSARRFTNRKLKVQEYVKRYTCVPGSLSATRE
jgi:hypothetical protein